MNNNRVKNNCIIGGQDVGEKQNTIDPVVRLSKAIGVEYEPNAINDAYFLNTKKKSDSGKKQLV